MQSVAGGAGRRCVVTGKGRLAGRGKGSSSSPLEAGLGGATPAQNELVIRGLNYAGGRRLIFDC